MPAINAAVTAMEFDNAAIDIEKNCCLKLKLHQYPEEQWQYQLCSAMIDGMSVRKHLDWDHNRLTVISYTDLKTGTNDNDNQHKASILVVIAVGQKGHWKVSLGYYVIAGISATLQAQLIKTVCSNEAVWCWHKSKFTGNGQIGKKLGDATKNFHMAFVIYNDSPASCSQSYKPATEGQSAQHKSYFVKKSARFKIIMYTDKDWHLLLFKTISSQFFLTQ